MRLFTDRTHPAGQAPPQLPTVPEDDQPPLRSVRAGGQRRLRPIPGGQPKCGSLHYRSRPACDPLQTSNGWARPSPRGAPFNPRGGFAGSPPLEPWLQRVSPRRIRLVMAMMGLMAAGLLMQLIRVQFGPYAPVFAARGDVGASRIEEVVPSRGLIYDRQGNLLAANASRYYLGKPASSTWSASAIAEVLSRTCAPLMTARPACRLGRLVLHPADPTDGRPGPSPSTRTWPG
jgi:hypothetical protein